MKPKADKTLADFVVIAISPVLIMALVGSLVFFLTEVLYAGQYEGRLLWILFFFVFGAVLVARIAIEYDAGRAALFGLFLGGAAWVGMLQFVEYPPGSVAADFGWAINLGLIAVIWWSTNRLTWDCTMIDDQADASGAGLMQAAGLDNETPTTASKPAKKPKRGKRKEDGLVGWGRRYQQYREERQRRPHVPGVWVVYFSFAALPLYGLGQSLIPPSEEERRRYAFWLMSVYVASGLGLLLTTSFLGLRRYLRQKKVQMPAAMTNVWLLSGAAMIAGFLVLGALLPRPAAEYALIDLPWRAGAKERNASRFAMRGNEAGKDKGRPGTKKEDDEKADAKDGKDKAGDSSAAKKDQSTKGKSDAKDKGGADEKKSDAGQESQSKKDGDAKGDDKSAPEQAKPNFTPPPLADWTAKLATVLKWIVLGAFALLIAFFLLRGLLTFLANFTGWARSLLDSFRNLWNGLWTRAGAKDHANEFAALQAMPAPFKMYHDPFLTGQAERLSAADLVRYTFEALQSWAAERELARQTGETPTEFAQRLAQQVPELAKEVPQLANYYAGLAYAGQTLGDDCRDPLRQLWHALAETARRDLPVEVPS